MSPLIGRRLENQKVRRLEDQNLRKAEGQSLMRLEKPLETELFSVHFHRI